MNFAKVSVGITSLALVATAACGSTSATSSSSKGTLVVETSFTYTDADPAVGGGTTGFIVEAQLYDTLVRGDPSTPGKIDPLLAQSWVVAPDGLSVTFKLRHGVKFSDGTPLTSADVVFSLMRTEYMNGVNSSLMTGLTVTATDPYTVVVTSSTPNVFITSDMTFAALGILNSKVVIANGGNDSPNAQKTDTATPWLDKHSEGSGPYELVSVDPSSEIVMKPNPNYWGSPKPLYRSVVIRNEAASAQLLDVQAQPNTMALDLAPQQAVTLPGSKVKVVTVPSLETFTLMLSADCKVSNTTCNLDFRQAVRYAIDYKALLNLAGKGAVQAVGLLPTGIPGALSNGDLISTDLTKAKSLLAASGVTSPSFTLTYASDVSQSGVTLADISTLIQANLQAVGITMKLNPIPNAVMRPLWFADKLQAQMQPLGGNTLDASGQIKYISNGHVSKWMGWTTGLDPAADAVATELKSNADPSQEDALIRQQQSTDDEFAVFIPLFVSPIVLAASNSIGNLNIDSLGIIQFAALT